jgi:hypothetical protein
MPRPDPYTRFSFGYAAKPEALTWKKRAGGRRTFEEVVHRERWENHERSR